MQKSQNESLEFGNGVRDYVKQLRPKLKDFFVNFFFQRTFCGGAMMKNKNI